MMANVWSVEVRKGWNLTTSSRSPRVAVIRHEICSCCVSIAIGRRVPQSAEPILVTAPPIRPVL